MRGVQGVVLVLFTFQQREALEAGHVVQKRLALAPDLLEAFLGAESTIDLAIQELAAARCVPLAQGVAMIPMTDGLFEQLQKASAEGKEESADPREGYLTAAVAEWAKAASRHGLLAYCEAAYANVTGGQSAVI